MAETLSQYQIPAFTTPQNGQPGDADQVRGNDNTIRGSFNNHDADTGIHLQSSALASRPAAGIGGRKWFTSDGLRLYYDNGSTWQEAGYMPAFGALVTGAPLSLGTADGNPINFSTSNTQRWAIDSSGNFFPSAASSVGTNGNRVGSVWFNGSLNGVSVLVNDVINTIGCSSGAGATNLNITHGGSGGIIVQTNSASAKIEFAPGGTTALKVANTGLQNNGGTQLIGLSRDTGYAAMTGTADKSSAFATSTVTLAQLAGRVMAIQAALTTHGLIGA